MRNESSPDRKKFLEYLEESSKIRDALRSDPEHQRLRKEIDALNEKTMSSDGGSDLHGRNKKTEVGADVVETEYNPSTGHYEQVNSPGTDDYVEGKISSTTSKTGCKEDEGEKNGKMDEAYLSASSFICHSNNIKDDLQR